MLPIPPIKGTRFHSIDQISSDIKALSPLSADRIASIATRPLWQAWGALNLKKTAQQLEFGFGIACCFLFICFCVFFLQKNNHSIYTNYGTMIIRFQILDNSWHTCLYEKNLRHLRWSKSSLPPFESQWNCLWNKLYEMVPETSTDYQMVGKQLDDETPWTLGKSWKSPFSFHFKLNPGSSYKFKKKPYK